MIWKYSPHEPPFLKLKAAGHSIQTMGNPPRPVKWRIENTNFSLIIGANGPVQYYPKGWGPKYAEALYEYLRDSVGFTNDDFNDLVKRLGLKRIEAASQVNKNEQGVLEVGKIATILFPGLTHIRAAKVEVYADGSFRVIEIETRGSASEAADTHKLIVNPAEAAAYMRQTRDAQLELSLLMAKVQEEIARMQIVSGDVQQKIVTEVRQIWHAMNSLEKGLIRIASQPKPEIDVKAIKDVVTDAIHAEMQPLLEEFRAGHIEQADLLREIKEGIHENTDVHRENNVILRDHENNEELRATEFSNQLDAHDQRTIAYHKDDVIRDNATNIHLEKVKGDIINHIDDRFERLAQYLEISRIDLVQQIEHFKTDLLTIARRQGHWIKKTALENYAATRLILNQVPDITAKRLAELLEVKHTRVYRWMEKLADFGISDSEKRVPDLDPISSGGPPTIPESEKQASSPKKRSIRRKILHFFLRVNEKEPKPELNEKTKSDLQDGKPKP